MQDATDEFNAIHSAKAKAMLKDYLIGRVGESKPKAVQLPLINEVEVRDPKQRHALCHWQATCCHSPSSRREQ